MHSNYKYVRKGEAPGISKQNHPCNNGETTARCNRCCRMCVARISHTRACHLRCNATHVQTNTLCADKIVKPKLILAACEKRILFHIFIDGEYIYNAGVSTTPQCIQQCRVQCGLLLPLQQLPSAPPEEHFSVSSTLTLSSLCYLPLSPPLYISPHALYTPPPIRATVFPLDPFLSRTCLPLQTSSNCTYGVRFL